MIPRQIAHKITELRSKFPVITLTGARQTGKTTLLKSVYNDLPYVNLEDIDNRNFAQIDPRGFLENYKKGAVIDEVQQVPQLFSYIQQFVDNNDVHFALSGSHNFLLMQNITQSLAGRTAILNMLPLSLDELKKSNYDFQSTEEMIFTGGYPRIFDKKISPSDFYPNYIQTYIERDVRMIKNIDNLSLFTTFVQLCAGRIGQVVNINSLANDVGISANTAKSWLSVLETSYIIYFLQPHHVNFNKRLIKSPKIYFYDTGLACSLLSVQSAQQLSTHYLKGNLFENYIINDIKKYYINKVIHQNIYFWQNKEKKEIDVIIDKAGKLYPIEIKSAKTKNLNFLDNLKYWNKLQHDKLTSNFMNIIYAGDDNFNTSFGNFVNYNFISKLLDKIEFEN